MAYECIAVRTEADKVGVITLNRPKQLNALNDQLMNELGEALKAFDADEKIGCIIVTGSEKAFAAGADITAMAKYSFADAYKGDFITRNWETLRTIRKPVIAAVDGPAFGAGFSLALAAVGALAVACFVKAYGSVFLGNPRGEATAQAAESPKTMLLPMGFLAAACAAIGSAGAAPAWKSRST